MQNIQIQPTVMVVKPIDQTEIIRQRFLPMVVGGLAIVQLVLGLIVLILGILTIVFHSVMMVVGVPIWCAMLFITTGIVGICSSMKKTKCTIIAFMVLSIVSAVFSITALLISMSIALVLEGLFIGEGSPSGPCYDEYGSYTCWGEYDTRVKLDGVLLGLAIIECIIAVISSAFCCRAVCCTGQPKVRTVVATTAPMMQPVPGLVMIPSQGFDAAPQGQPVAVDYPTKEPVQ